MRRNKQKPAEVLESENTEKLSGELVIGPRAYTLSKPITYRGVPKVPGDLVKLNDRQAERLKGSGHI